MPLGKTVIAGVHIARHFFVALMKNTALFKDFAKYTSLNILGMLSISCYIVVDTFFVSKGLGVDGLAALNFAIPVFGFIFGSGLMLGIGGATKYAILKSQNNMEKANRVFTGTIFILLGFIMVFFAAGLFFADAVTRIFRTDEAVFEMTKTYLRIILLFSPLLMTQSVLQCFIRNDGAPQLSMLAMVSSSLSNIVLDFVFIILLGMGMFGAALATGLSSVIGLFILSTFFIRRKNCFNLTKRAISGRLTKEILGIGLPSLIMELSVGIVMIVFNAIILYLKGNTGVAAYGVVANIWIFVFAVYTGIAQGIQPILSSNYGSGNMANVRAVLRYALILTAAVSAAVYLCIFFGAQQIAGIFNREQNMLMQYIAAAGLRIHFISSIFAGFNIIMSTYFTSTEFTRPAHIISLLRGFLIIIPMVFLLSAIGGITGVWLALPATEFIVAVIGLSFFLFFRKTFSRKNAGLPAASLK